MRIEKGRPVVTDLPRDMEWACRLLYLHGALTEREVQKVERRIDRIAVKGSKENRHGH